MKTHLKLQTLLSFCLVQLSANASVMVTFKDTAGGLLVEASGTLDTSSLVSATLNSGPSDLIYTDPTRINAGLGFAGNFQPAATTFVSGFVVTNNRWTANSRGGFLADSGTSNTNEFLLYNPIVGLGLPLNWTGSGSFEYSFLAPSESIATNGLTLDSSFILSWTNADNTIETVTFYVGDPATIPEPSSFLLISLGSLATLCRRKR